MIATGVFDLSNADCKENKVNHVYYQESIASFQSVDWMLLRGDYSTYSFLYVTVDHRFTSGGKFLVECTIVTKPMEAKSIDDSKCENDPEVI